jgi:GDPmannose 4,6-dehydratase
MLRARKMDVVGVSRSDGDVRGSIADGALVDGLVRTRRPSHVFHLAANSTVSHDALFENHDSISTGTLNVLEAVRRHTPEARVFIAGSGLQFVNSGQPISEAAEFSASSPYAVARIHSVFAARYFREAFGVRAYVGYLFHHDSALRNERHFNQKVVRAVQRIAGGSRELLTVGHLATRKEFSYAGDVVSAIWRLVSQDREFEVVIGSGDARELSEWVRYCFSARGLNWEDHIRVDSNAVPSPTLVSDPRRMRSLGWSPSETFEGLADRMLADRA